MNNMPRLAGFTAALLLAALPLCAAESKGIQFFSDRMYGSGAAHNEKTVLEGRAKVIVGSLLIEGERIELSGTDFRFVSASGSVKGQDSEKGFSFAADSMRYDRTLEIAVFEGNATLTDTRNNVEAAAGIINYNQKSEIALLQVNVKLVRENIQCSAAFAVYRRESSALELSGSPVVTRSGDEFKARRIFVNLETENITLEGGVSGLIKETSTPGESAAVSEKVPPAVPPDLAPESAPAVELTDDETPETEAAIEAEGETIP